jgi:lipopolysaccharide assembly protein A
MRFLCFLFLVAFAGAAGLLAYENRQEVTLTVFETYSVTTTIPVLVGLTYLAGMLSGWTVVGMLRRSVDRVLREPLPGEYARSR